jgi:putative transposase
MTRQRDCYAGIFHVTTHSVWGAALFRDDVDRADYVEELERTVNDLGPVCISVVLLTTHAHHILEVDDEMLPEAMQRINHRHAVRFNRRHDRRGHVFGCRYDSRRIPDDAYLLTAFRYDARNPVEAGIAERPQDALWSSYAAAVGLRDDFQFVNPARVLACLHPDVEIARARLRAFVEAA